MALCASGTLFWHFCGGMLDGMINGTYDDLKYIVMFIVVNVVVMDICCGDDSAGGATATPQLHVVLVVV